MEKLVFVWTASDVIGLGFLGILFLIGIILLIRSALLDFAKWIRRRF